MFDVSFFELVIIGLIALLVLGPNKLLEAARFAGYWLGRVRKQFSQVKEDIDREMRMDELRRRLADEERALKEEMQAAAPAADVLSDVKSEVQGVADQLAATPSLARTDASAEDGVAGDSVAGRAPGNEAATGETPVGERSASESSASNKAVDTHTAAIREASTP